MRASQMFHGKLVPGSGSSVGLKGDVCTDRELIEVKYTTQKSFSIRPESLKSLVYSANIAALNPVLAIEFDNDSKREFWVAVPTNDYLILRAKVEGLERENDMLRNALHGS